MSEVAFGQPKSEFELGEDDLQLSEYERELAQKLFRPETILQISDRFIGYLAERLVLAGFNLPISQVSGFTGFTVRIATRVNPTETTTSGTYTDLTTVGPELTDLPPGRYLLMAACEVNAPTINGYISFNVNGTTPSDNDAGKGEVGNLITFVTKDLTVDGPNTVKVQYKSSSGGTNSQYTNRMLLALKFSNL